MLNVRREIIVRIEGNVEAVNELASRVAPGIPLFIAAEHGCTRYQIENRVDVLDENGQVVPPSTLIEAANFLNKRPSDVS